MITVALVSALAGLWMWVVMNDDEGIVGPVARLLHRQDGKVKKWITCPWCSGAWFAGGWSLVAYHPSVVLAAVTALAAAALTGLFGSYVQGD